ncbi:MAG TPA: hypothetical protein VM582_02255, partial [Candidatus Thermoplasmatota archaeon]|nr:hypothetical protein [Candidatus Thermoplasmatota archaeon]
ARVGAPVADGRGRVLVPFSFTPRDPLAPATGLLLPALAPTALYYATMGPREGAWTTRGGVPAPQGVAEPPALERGPRGATALLWVDASGALQRVETWDDGGSWGAPEPWSDLAAHAAGAPAALRPDQRATAAWWEARDGGASLVVARAEGGAAPAARLEVAWLPEPRASAALSLVEGSRAVVAWATQAGEVWLGVEGGALPAPGCDDAAHCLPRVHAW